MAPRLPEGAPLGGRATYEALKKSQLDKGGRPAEGEALPPAALKEPRGNASRDASATGLVPIYIALDLPNQNLRETFLWRLNDPHWTVATAAARLRMEMGLGPQYEKIVHDQIRSGLHKYEKWAPVGGAKGEPAPGGCEVTLNIECGVDGQTFTDTVRWDLNDPQNAPDEYAYSVCADEGLPPKWIEPITEAVRDALARSRAELEAKTLQPLPPPAPAAAASSPNDGPSVSVPSLS